ncbi:MAG: Fic family protein [Anaeroplasmataceae bacterium]
MEQFEDRFYKETLVYDKPVFKNKLNIRNNSDLEKVELEISIKRLYEINQNSIPGDFDFNHLQKYHEHIFGALYEWAGAIRKFGVMKSEEVLNGASVPYEDPFMIVPVARNAINNFNSIDFSNVSIDDKTSIFCDTLATLWKAHPFNEGNTRTITKFMCDLASSKGIAVDNMLFTKNKQFYRKALVVYQYGVKEYLKKIVKDAILRCSKSI